MAIRRFRELFCLAISSFGFLSCGNGDDVTTVGATSSDATTDTTRGAADGATEMGLDASDAGADVGCAVDAGPLDDAMIALGHQIVSAHRCQLCHGETLTGNTDGVQSPTVIGGFAYPPNLTSDPGTGLGCWTNEQIEEAILFGIDNQNSRLCPPMPVFGHLLDGGLDLNQARAVVTFLRSLPTAMLKVPDTPDCPIPEAGAEAGPESDASNDGGTPMADTGPETHPDGATEASAEAGSEAGIHIQTDGGAGTDSATDGSGERDGPDAG